MLLRAVRSPDLILVLSSLLTFDVLESALRACARVELADGLGVAECAVRYRTVCTVAAGFWMNEGTIWLRAINTPSALLAGRE